MRHARLDWVKEKRKILSQTERYKTRKRASLYKVKYGITLEQYDKMFSRQSGTCAICLSINPSGRRLHIDHNHKTGRVRGLLCYRCNAAIGYAREDRNIISEIFRYLLKYESRDHDLASEDLLNAPIK